MKMIGNVQGTTCAYWGHALSNYLINFAPNMKDGLLKKVGETISADFMQKSKRDYTLEESELVAQTAYSEDE